MDLQRLSSVRGGGLLGSLGNAVGTVINRTIDFLPVELHLPGYQYCGPGTNLRKRLARGDPGINKLDAACKQHDIAYSRSKDGKIRSKADKILADRAWERVKASDSSLTEKAAAWAVTNIMKAKAKFGGGRVKSLKIKKKSPVAKKKRKSKCSCKKRKSKSGKGLYLKPYTGSGSSKSKKKCTHRK